HQEPQPRVRPTYQGLGSEGSVSSGPAAWSGRSSIYQPAGRLLAHAVVRVTIREAPPKGLKLAPAWGNSAVTRSSPRGSQKGRRRQRISSTGRPSMTRAVLTLSLVAGLVRSEERRVGKEWRWGWAGEQCRKREERVR